MSLDVPSNSGPSKSIWEVDADQMEERIKARRERIQTRIQAAKRLTKLMKIQKLMGFKGDDEEENFVREADTKGSKEIHNMLQNGNELVSNIQVATQNLYCQHRVRTEDKSKEITSILEEEDREMIVKFKKIMSSWPTQVEKLRGAPVELFDEILSQKELCSELLRSKNSMIEMLEAENRDADSNYKLLIEQYHINVNEISGRMEAHAQAFENILKTEHTNIDTAFDKQKSDAISRGERAWTALLEGATRTSEELMQERLDLVYEQEQELNDLIIVDYEKLADTRTRMEMIIRELEAQIQTVASITYLNSERLDYEIHVLNKHEEENAIIKSEQKRKITILQDTLSKLKGRVKDAAKNKKKEKQLLLESIKTIKKQIKELQIKQKKCGVQSAKTRNEMNRMMKQEAHKLLDEISENDDVLQKLYLKRPFAEAAMARRASEYMLGRLGTSVPDSDVSEFFKSAKSSRRTSRASSRSKSARSRTEVSPKEGAKKLKEMLLSLIEKADFLVEDDLNALMEVLPDKDKLLLKVDSILSALGVNEEKDIEKIFNHLKISDTEEELAGLDADDTLSVAEKRSKILKIVRGYMEEPETTQRTEQNRQALFSGFNIMKKMTGAIKPDKEGYLWDELKESIEMFKTPDKTNLKHLLTKYKDLLLVRADLMGRNEKLKTQNNELKTLLKNVLPNQP